MPINITAAGTAGTHAFARVNVNTEEEYLYYSASNVPASIINGATYIFNNGTGSLTGLGASGSLVYANKVSAAILKFKDSANVDVNLTAATAGNISLNNPVVFNNILQVGSSTLSNQAVKYFTAGAPMTGLVSGNTYFLRNVTATFAGVQALYTLTGNAHTFNTAGVTGENGPTITQLRAAYTTANAWSGTYLQQGNFQGYQDWTVPVSGIYEITASGASGFDGSGTGGVGRGATVRGRVSLTKGEVITITVGQRGTAGSGGIYGGSGGGTFVVRKANAQPLFVAGGGSAEANSTAGRDAVLTTAAGTSTNGLGSGGLVGSGGLALSSGQGFSAGGGGFNTRGDNGPTGELGGGSFLTGLNMGTTNSRVGGYGGFGGGAQSDAPSRGQSGGGGGFSGGGGARSDTALQAGGGGGSFITPLATTVATSTGFWEGSPTFNGVAITNLNSFNTGEGSVGVSLISAFSTGHTFHPTAQDAADNTNAIAIAAAGNSNHAITPINVDLDSDTLHFTSPHGLVSGDALVFRTPGTPPGGLLNNTLYYVVRVNDYSYRLSLSATLTPIVNITTPGFGTNENFGKVVVNTATGVITIPSHGFLTNQPVNYQIAGATLRAIASISRSGSTATATTTTNHNFVTGQVIVVSGSANPDLEGSYIIASVPTATTFTYITTTSGTLTAIAGGNVNLNQNVPVTTAARSGNTVTVTSSIHGFSVGQQVRIAGSLSDFNGTYAIVTVPSATTFTYVTTTSGTASASGGTAAVNVAIEPLQDNATYFVKTVVDNNNIRLSQSLNGPAINFTSAGLGTGHSFLYVVVNLVEDSFYIPGHGYVTGTKITYRNGGGTSIGSVGNVLVNNQSYLILRQDDNIVKLTNPVGGATIDLTTLGTGNQSFTTNAFDPDLDTISIPGHGFSAGELVQYDTSGQTAIGGLSSGSPYYVIQSDGNTIKLATSLVNANAGNAINLTTAGVGIHRILSLTKSPDGTYTISSVPTTTTFQVQANGLVPTIVKAFNPRRVLDLQSNRLQVLSHGFITGTKVTYSNGGDASLGGLTNNVDYFIINLNKDYVRLASTAENASSGVPVVLTSWGSGITHSLTTNQINGYVTGTGTVSTASGSTLVNGTGTAFAKILKVGDLFRLFPADVSYAPTFAPAALAISPTNNITITAHTFVTGDNAIFSTALTAPTGIVNGFYYFIRRVDANTIRLFNTAADATANINPVSFSNQGTGTHSLTKTTFFAPIIRKITAIGSDTQITVDRPYSTAYTGVSYSYSTFLYVRPQGYSLHRSFDGGVEMSVGTNTSFGQIIRQTRKYFRYQSGKGLQTSFGINFKPTIDIENIVRISATTFKATTRRPHSLVSGLDVVISEATTSTGAPSTLYNGTFQVTVLDSFNFTCIASTAIPTGAESTAYGFPQFNCRAWSNGAIRSGMFDFQNGLFWEFDGQKLYAVRRSSTQQLAGTASALQGSEFVFGTGTQFTKQLAAGDMIVLRGQSYKVSSVLSATRLTIKPEYKGSTAAEIEFVPGNGTTGVVRVSTSTFFIPSHGLTEQLPVVYNSIDGSPIGGLINGRTYYVSIIDNNNFKLKASPDAGSTVTISDSGTGTPHSFTPAKSGIIITKTVDTRTPQEEFSLDKLDGTGPTGYKIDVSRIQMAYIDYSWYGAGKIRYGFKDQTGEVKYVHEYIHNNIKLESYFRSGNLPARYEVATFDNPTYIPFLFHWGTSVMMDGKFDDDKAYLFSQNSSTLQVAGTTAKSFGSRAITVANDQVTVSTHGFSTGDAVTFIGLTSNGQIGTNTQNPTVVAQAGYNFTNLQNNSTLYIRVVDPNIITFHPTNADAVATGGTNRIDFTSQGNAQYTYYLYPLGSSNNTSGANYQPLISIRLSPSVSSGLVGKLGDRDVINRMQLRLNELAISTTFLVDVKLLINPRLNNLNFNNAAVPSLTQYIQHTLNDTVSGGTQIYNFRATGAPGGGEDSTTVDVSSLYEIGNSILGGDSVFPDGPDILTIAVARLTGSSTLTSAKLSWTEAQA